MDLTDLVYEVTEHFPRREPSQAGRLCVIPNPYRLTPCRTVLPGQRSVALDVDEVLSRTGLHAAGGADADAAADGEDIAPGAAGNRDAGRVFRHRFVFLRGEAGGRGRKRQRDERGLHAISLRQSHQRTLMPAATRSASARL